MANQDNRLVFKIMSETAWRESQATGALVPSSDDARDGFIHLSADHQLDGTAAKYFSGIQGLVLVAFAAHDLAPGLRWETSRGGDLFPHYYGVLPAHRAKWSKPLALDAQGRPLIRATVGE
jgi:uncharacterized protein (DUF952 family)